MVIHLLAPMCKLILFFLDLKFDYLSITYELG